ncbi:hypothetical protein [Arsukibacterium sp.]|uniref:hypothetical protein n=1 Tax=Arsukibacterium sp. TaxID=1977258 RepID=UPI001BD5862A|nr:hypothetical protein [Arsukibacterium sp.]
MDKVTSRVIAVILGVALAWASVPIIGIGAAVAIPAEIVKPVAQVSGLLAFTLVDFFTIAIPLAAAFLVLAFASKLVINKPDRTFYLLLLAPVVLFQLYFLLQGLLQSQPQLLNVIVTTLPRYILLAVCCYLLVRSTRPAKTR